jgi:hypothetical protein
MVSTAALPIIQGGLQPEPTAVTAPAERPMAITGWTDGSSSEPETAQRWRAGGKRASASNEPETAQRL